MYDIYYLDHVICSQTYWVISLLCYLYCVDFVARSTAAKISTYRQETCILWKEI